MKTVLIISPRFPPINAPDMHRVRHSLPYFEGLGWKAEVWAVDPQRIERDRDPLLAHTVPLEASVHTVGALDPAWTRLVGLGSLALRSLPFYARAVSQRLARGDVDLVYFSTTAFPVMVLGRYWKRRYGVPYIIDMQDPWHNTYYLDQPPEERPTKFWFSYRLHKYLEPVAMRTVDGIISVSQEYCDTLCRRYENITQDQCTVIPFGASPKDFEIARRDVGAPLSIELPPRRINVVYAGAISPAMQVSIQVLMQALSIGREEHPSVFGRVRLHFVGTSYAPAGEGRKSVKPVAEAFGVGHVVNEYPDRIPYFEALRLLDSADHLVLLGSDGADYTASKLASCILACRPILAVFHKNSSVADILSKTNAGTTVVFDEGSDQSVLARHIVNTWTHMLERLPYTPATDWDAFAPYTAEAMTRRQVEVFDQVLARRQGEASSSA